MNDPEYEIHPLDKDYSNPVQAPFGTQVEFDVKLRRLGMFVFAAGFALLFVVAIVLGTFRGSGMIETIGSSVHRFAMVMILIGGVVIIVAYRLPQWKGKNVRVPAGGLRWNVTESFQALVIWNIVGFVAISLVGRWLLSVTSGASYFIIVNATLTLTCAWLATVAVWHRGFIRAYAIGVLVALCLNSYSSLFAIRGSWRSDSFLLFANVSLILLSGLVCAGYVCRLESANSERSDPADN